jgi:hypothetical protein
LRIPSIISEGPERHIAAVKAVAFSFFPPPARTFAFPLAFLMEMANFAETRIKPL